jgi:hypothetical protein
MKKEKQNKEDENGPRVPMGGRGMERMNTNLRTNSAWLSVHARRAGRALRPRVSLLPSCSLVTGGSRCTFGHDETRKGTSETGKDDMERFACGSQPQLRVE